MGKVKEKEEEEEWSVERARGIGRSRRVSFLTTRRSATTSYQLLRRLFLDADA